MSNLTCLRSQLGVNSLLSAVNSNPKTAKNEKLNISTATLHLAPARLSGYETCPGRSEGCTNACLNFAGNPIYMENKTKARIKRTKALFENRQAFLNLLALELHAHIERCKKAGFAPAARLNATSDIRFEALRFELYDWVKARINREGSTIIDMFKDDCSMYDYTKLWNRRVPDGYHLTFSLNETNQDKAQLMIDKGYNVAVVFENKLPDTYLGRPVISGDEHDYRPIDPKGSIVGLVVKGAKGKVDTSGFVVRL